jgi:hypothetical protein
VSAETVRRIVEELVTQVLTGWQVVDVSEPLAQGDRDVERVTVTFEIAR